MLPTVAKQSRPDWAAPDFFIGDSQGERGFWRLVYRQFVPAKGHRTYLTISGWMLILLSLGVGGTAYNSASNILFMTLALMLSSLVLSGILSVINFKKLSWRLVLPPELRAGGMAVGRLYLRNDKRFFPTFGVWFNSQAGNQKKSRLLLEDPVGPGEERELEWTLRPEKRGALDLELSGVESKYPFGFIRKSVGGIRRHTVWVWPRRVNYLFEPRNLGRHPLSGNLRARLGQGDDLLNIRPYVAGDPPRMVHWKATARSGRLMVRQVSEEAENAYFIQLETRLTTWRTLEHFEQHCSLAVSLAEDLYHRNRLQGYAIDDGEIIRIRGISDLHRFFDCVAHLHPEGQVPPPHRRTPGEWIHFKPSPANTLVIYIGNEPAGQIND